MPPGLPLTPLGPVVGQVGWSGVRGRAGATLSAAMPEGLARFRRDALTGVSVGLTDIALVYPLAVIATRRENGMSLRAALAARNLHSGGWTAGTLLVPYSVLVESMSQHLNSMHGSGADSDAGRLKMFGAAAATSVVASIGVQPIEKKLTMDQMLESGRARAAVAARHGGSTNPLLTPLREIAAYTREAGAAALFGGFTPLLAREFIYIAAITAVNPIVTSYVSQRAESSAGGAGAALLPAAAAFGVGCTAGVLSAPCQTMNALMKSEKHRGVRMSEHLRRIFGKGARHGVWRLYYGALTRSVRCGGAGVLYYVRGTPLGPTTSTTTDFILGLAELQAAFQRCRLDLACAAKTTYNDISYLLFGYGR